VDAGLPWGEGDGDARKRGAGGMRRGPGNRPDSTGSGVSFRLHDNGW
jgi:hypothetical protein